MNESLLHKNALELLRTEFNRRRSRNPAFSLRSFSRKLGLSPALLSGILSEKKPITEKVGRIIAERLELTPHQSGQLAHSIREARQRAQGIRILPQRPQAVRDYLPLPAEKFELVSEWFHFAILSLARTRGFRADFGWIARRLGISAVQARTAWRRLERLQMIHEIDGKWKVANEKITTTTDVPLPALRKANRHQIENALQALEDVTPELRDITSMVMAIDISRIREAKSIIRQFRHRLCDFLEQGNLSEVYGLNIQLFPITRKGEK